MSNLIMKDTYMLGCVKDIIGHFKEESIKLLEEMNILHPYSDSFNAEDMLIEINYNLNLINSIYQDIMADKLIEDTLIIVFFKDCKDYEYKILVEKESR